MGLKRAKIKPIVAFRVTNKREIQAMAYKVDFQNRIVYVGSIVALAAKFPHLSSVEYSSEARVFLNCNYRKIKIN